MVPVEPSGLSASRAVMLTTGWSSLMTVPAALVVPSVAPLGVDRTTENCSVSSMRWSATACTVSVLRSSPALKLTVPLVAPVKSSALVPLEVACCSVQATVLFPRVVLRTTVNAMGVLAEVVPSALAASVAVMPITGVSSLVMVPEAMAVPITAPVACDR